MELRKHLENIAQQAINRAQAEGMSVDNLRKWSALGILVFAVAMKVG